MLKEYRLSKLKEVFFATRNRGEENGAQELAIIRIILYGSALVFYARFDVERYWELAEYSWRPISYMKLLPKELITNHFWQILHPIWLASLALSALGLFTRFSTIVSFLMCLPIIGMLNSIVRATHMENMLVFAFLAMALSPCGDHFSIDAWVPWNKTKMKTKARGNYKQTIIFLRVMFVMIFFSAGMSKLRDSGISWGSEEWMKKLIAQSVQFSDRKSPNLWMADFFLQNGLLLSIGTKLAMICELAAPLTLISRVYALPILAGLLAMQIGNWMLLGIAFPQMMFCYIIWIPLGTCTWLKPHLNWLKKAPLPYAGNRRFGKSPN